MSSDFEWIITQLEGEANGICVCRLGQYCISCAAFDVLKRVAADAYIGLKELRKT